MASVLVARSAAARAHLHPLGLRRSRPPAAPSPAAGDFGLAPRTCTRPTTPHHAPGAQTIAIIDAYNDPAAETDLRTYDEAFSLPACTTANGCFKQVNQNGETGNLPFPKTLAELETARKGSKAEAENAAEAIGWGLEISLDIETAHAVCQSATSCWSRPRTRRPRPRSRRARRRDPRRDRDLELLGRPRGRHPAHEHAGPFNHPGTVITASAGDNGYLDWNSGRRGRITRPPPPTSSPSAARA